MHSLPEHDVVLLGLGHTNAHVLRMWRMEPIPRTRLTCVSNYPIATYSGMLPGVLAGQYEPEAMEIDLVRLCAAAGARLILGEVTGLDRQQQTLFLANRPPLSYDVLSIGIGSVPSRERLAAADDTVLPIKPMQTLLARLAARLRGGAGLKPALQIVIVGGGVGGVEVAFCLSATIKKLLPHAALTLTLIDSNGRLVSGASEQTAARVQRELEQRGTRVVLGRRVTRIEQGRVTLDNGEVVTSDIVLWATSAASPPLLGQLGLPLDDRGFLLTRPTLQSTADDRIFAVGDAGTITGSNIPKAGVYAVRQGPFLWENLRQRLAGAPLRDYQPQAGFLKLINTGDGRAIGEYLGFTFSGAWVWRLKDRIDRKFMAKYQDYTPMAMREDEDDDEEDENKRQARCLGCGGKVGGSVLSRVLGRLEIPSHPSVKIGLATPDDVALIQSNGGQPLAVTTDFFAPPLDDPYLVGRLAALHAASDVLAKGARPIAALTIATIPPGPDQQQEQLLSDLLAGGLAELKAMGATIAGGHTIEGPQTMIGYTIVAEQPNGKIRTKSGLRPGDVLILTKPLGIGVLLAGHMQARLHAAWYEPLMRALLASNQPAAEVLDDFDVLAATDVTGFGLAGHLLEMLQASSVSAEIELGKLPLLEGALHLFVQGLQSTLAPANRTAEREMSAENVRDLLAYPVLFDPHTCGGLLFGAQPEQVAAILTRLAGTPTFGSVIGTVRPAAEGPRLRLA